MYVYEEDGIQLDYGNIMKNPTRRQIAKLGANSLWGKFIELSSYINTKIFDDGDEFAEFIENRGVSIANCIAGENKAVLSWKYTAPDDVELTRQSSRESVITGILPQRKHAVALPWNDESRQEIHMLRRHR